METFSWLFHFDTGTVILFGSWAIGIVATIADNFNCLGE